MGRIIHLGDSQQFYRSKQIFNGASLEVLYRSHLEVPLIFSIALKSQVC
jgi:hypothetical protein